MKIRFLGFGGAFDTHLTNSSALVSHSGIHTLIDCGHSVFPFLNNSGAINLIDQVVLTHLHDDHVGSLSALAIFYSMVLKKGPLQIFVATPEFESQIRKLLAVSLINIDRYANIRLLSEAKGEISAIDTQNLHMEGLLSFSYVFREENQAVVYSGDLGDCDFLLEKIEKMGLSEVLVFHELSFDVGARGHTHYLDLGKWLDKYQIYGYHCDPARNPVENRVPLVANFPEFLWEGSEILTSRS